MKTDRFRITMEFPNGTLYAFNTDEPGNSEWLRAGEWTFPFPNTTEDSLVFGLIEMYSQSEGAAHSILWENGEPETVKIEALS